MLHVDCFTTYLSFRNKRPLGLDTTDNGTPRNTYTNIHMYIQCLTKTVRITGI